MKALINQFVRKRRAGVKDAVHINHILMYAYKGLMVVKIDTKERWCDNDPCFTSGTHTAVDIFFHDEVDGKNRSTCVTLLPETPEEEALMREYCVRVSNKYGPTYLFAPMEDDKTQVVLYEDKPKKKRKTPA